MPEPTNPNPPNPNSPPPTGATPEVVELQKKIDSLTAHLEEVKAESITRRKENASLRQAVDAFRGALGIEGDPAQVEGKVKEAVAGKDAAIRELLIEREVERAAAKAGLNPSRIDRAAKLLDLSDVEVDISARKITKGDFGAKLETLKTEIPELFGVKPPSDPTPKPPARTQDPGAPPPPPAGSVAEQWLTATQNGDRQAMAKLMREHGAEIGRYADSLPKRA